MCKRLTQVQAEEQCRLLRLKRNAATQQADTVYQKTMQSLFDNYTEELKRLDERIVTYRYKITTLRTEMAEAWDKAVSEGKDEVRGAMGILMAPFKEKINTTRPSWNPSATNGSTSPNTMRTTSVWP